jgi:metal-sulfur cluster biosynthetic enzyme
MNVAEKEEIHTGVMAALHNVFDPELGVNIVDLGLVYGVEVNDDGAIDLRMTLTTQGCPMHASISQWVSMALQTVPGLTGGEIHLVWEPPWHPGMMTQEGRRELGYPD